MITPPAPVSGGGKEFVNERSEFTNAWVGVYFSEAPTQENLNRYRS